MEESKNNSYSKSSILKNMRNLIKKYNLGNYLILGDDEVLHINEDFRKKVYKLIQDNPNGFAKYVVKVLGYDNIVKGVAENIFEEVTEVIEEDRSERNLKNYEPMTDQEQNNIIKEYIKNGSYDEYVEDFQHFFDAVGKYYELEEPKIKELLKASDIADIFKVINNLDFFNSEMNSLYRKISAYRQNYYHMSDCKITMGELEENLKFVGNLYSETDKFSINCESTFLHGRSLNRYGDDERPDNYFDRWNIEDEVKFLSHSNKLLNDVTNYLLKNYNSMKLEYNKDLDYEEEIDFDEEEITDLYEDRLLNLDDDEYEDIMIGRKM